MQDTKHITIIINRKKTILNSNSIFYIIMCGKIAEIHVSNGRVYKTYMTLDELEEQLGEGFIKVHRGCLVSAMAIHDITDYINLSNGEHLGYTIRKKKQIIDQLYEQRKHIVSHFVTDGIPKTQEKFKKYYEGFDHMPFAFADIEMIFDEERRAVDWIFRYGNPALAKLEKIPLDQLIGNTFGSLFSNMHSKWLRSYERVVLYGETLEIIDYSPEIDTYLKVICFPTFEGHCGCILFDISDIRFTKNSSDADYALKLYLEQPEETDPQTD